MPARLQHQARSLQRQVQQRAMYTRSDGDVLSEWMEPAGVCWLGAATQAGAWFPSAHTAQPWPVQAARDRPRP